MEQKELIKQTVRKFINSPDLKEELDPVTRLWLEQHIVIMAEGLVKAAIKNSKKDSR